MDNQTQSIQKDGKNIQATPSSTDDESMTTSTASDSFDSWTLVMDKQQTPTTSTAKSTDDENHIQELKFNSKRKLETSNDSLPEDADDADDDDEEEQDDEPPPDYNAATGTASATDEFSDEVSIISESDSCELLATTQNLSIKDKDFLQKLNLKFTTGVGLDLPTILQEQHLVEQRFQQKQKTDETITTAPVPMPTFKTALANQNLRQRKRRSPSTEQQKSLRTTTATVPYEPDDGQHQKIPFCCLAAKLIKNGIYILMGLMALIAFTKMFTHTDNSPLEQKMADLKTENVALRFKIFNFEQEVKLLNEDVTALKNKLQKDEIKPKINGFATQFHKKHRPEEEMADVEELIKQAIEDGKKAELKYETEKAKRKAENEAEEARIRDEIEKIVFTTDNNNNNSENQESQQPEQQQQQFNNQKDNKKSFKEKRISKEINYHSGERNFKQKRKAKSNGNSKERYYDNDDDNKSEERFSKQNRNKNSKQRRENDSKENFNKQDSSNEKINKCNSSHEKCNKKRNDNHSKEHKNYKSNSNEILNERQQPKHKLKNRRNRKSFDSDENQSGEWMENLMLQREKARREQEAILKAEKNWFLNRQDGREQWRVNDENHS